MPNGYKQLSDHEHDPLPIITLSLCSSGWIKLMMITVQIDLSWTKQKLLLLLDGVVSWDHDLMRGVYLK